MKKNLFFNGLLVLCLTFGISACEEDIPAPTVEFTFEVDGSDVTFTSTATNTSSYLWDFGDGATSTEANPVHTYDVSGTYTVTLAVTGEGGESTATYDVEILPSFVELLTGGPTATNGKTWVLSTEYNEGVDGGGAVDNNLIVLLAGAEDILTAIGFPEEYDNEFTFYSDGTYVVDNKNGKSIAGLMFALFGGVEGEVGQTEEANALGLCTKAYTAPASSTWTLHEDDLVVTAAPYGGQDVPAFTYDVTFTGHQWIELSDDAYFGILDYPNTRKFIVKSITTESMSVAIFIGQYWADPENAGMYPTLLYHLTFIPKP